MLTSLQELDRCQTPLGELTLWRRRSASQGGTEFYEVRLDGEFLMSSLVNHSEIALAKLALAELPDGEWDILVGGLGLGYTAKAALDFPNVRSVTVVEYLEPVINWHRWQIVPLGVELTTDGRCRLVQADFFDMVGPSDGTVEANPASQTYHGILIDIDHSPCHLIRASHAPFYETEGLRRLAAHLAPGGVFALWSAEPPEEEFLARLHTVFAHAKACEVEFFNPLVDEKDTNCIYIAAGPRRHRGSKSSSSRFP